MSTVERRRGEPDFDRAYRHDRARKQQAPALAPGSVSVSTPALPPSDANLRTLAPWGWSAAVSAAQNEGEDVTALDSLERHGSGRSTSSSPEGWNLLPPFEEVVEGCHIFIRSYFQLGFLPKTSFFERLRKQRETVSVFLLLSILSISARFTPSLVRRYGNGQNATNVFLQNAATMTLDYMYKPSLDAIQSFFLISLAEWGKGEKARSSTHMAIAVRMAGTLRLHREETYQLPDNATADEVVESEVARRTFWMLENHDSLHSGYNSPVSFSLSDITTLLPCEENDFAFGNNPAERAALTGTAAALKDDKLTKSASRSLFATLIQCHNIWGQIARRVGRNEINSQPRETVAPDVAVSADEHLRLLTLLKDFEDNLPARHRWSIWNLRGFKAEKLDLAYLSVVTMTRLSNIILRRTPVHGTRMIDMSSDAPSSSLLSQCPTSDGELNITVELFNNLIVLNEQIDAFFSLRSPKQGFPAFIIYCTYICGTLASYLQKDKSLCASIEHATSRTNEILASSTRLLSDLQDAWPMTERWRDALLKACHDQEAPRLDLLNGEQQADGAAVRLTQASASDKTMAGSRLGAGVPHADLPEVFDDAYANDSSIPEASDTDVMDVMLQDPWHHDFSSSAFMNNLDGDLAFNLWPSGDLWQN